MSYKDDYMSATSHARGLYGGQLYKHRKGGVYRTLGRAKGTCLEGDVLEFFMPGCGESEQFKVLDDVRDESAVLYEDVKSGKKYIRPEALFHDGRFIPMVPQERGDKTLLNALGEAVDTLRFYADVRNYQGNAPGYSAFTQSWAADDGELARVALAHLGEDVVPFSNGVACQKCPDCFGMGFIPQFTNEFLSGMRALIEVSCERCKGIGRVSKSEGFSDRFTPYDGVKKLLTAQTPFSSELEMSGTSEYLVITDGEFYYYETASKSPYGVLERWVGKPSLLRECKVAVMVPRPLTSCIPSRELARGVLDGIYGNLSNQYREDTAEGEAINALLEPEAEHELSRVIANWWAQHCGEYGVNHFWEEKEGSETIPVKDFVRYTLKADDKLAKQILED